MDHTVAALIPSLLPAAIAWAQRCEQDILDTGLALNDAGVLLARRVGVQHPERVRLKFVDAIPRPEDPAMLKVIELGGFLGPTTAGLTLGHGIYIRNGTGSTRLVSHELRHVYQYEVAGSIASYLPVYLQQVVTHGYLDAPYEVDARAFEVQG